jgi:hypothetical protein
MTANINPESGIPYAVIHGDSVPYLMDDICSSGDDLTYAAFKEDLESRVRAALAGVVEDHCSAECAAKIVERMGCADIVESMLDSGFE